MFEDLTGQKFGMLKVVRFLKPEERFYNGKLKSDRVWECVCECGNKINVATWKLKNGNTKSCGCYRKEKLKENQIDATHGKTNTLLYRTWDGMKKRCYNKNDNNYENYGGRGIKMCDEWKNNFQAFYTWAINNGYKKELSIDRIDVDGNYEPSNCRWATAKEQSRNRRDTLYVEYNGEKRTLIEVSEEVGISYGKMYARIFEMGKSLEEAIAMKGYSENKCKRRKEKINGEILTVSEFCDKYGITDKSFAYRWINKGKDFEWILARWNEKENVPENYIDSNEYSRIIGVTRTHVQRMLKSGKLKGRKFGRKWYVLREQEGK